MNGNWGTWTNWGACTVSCGTGAQVRSRSCDDPAPANGGSDCAGDNSETQSCNTPACPGNVSLMFSDSDVSLILVTLQWMGAGDSGAFGILVM